MTTLRKRTRFITGINLGFNKDLVKGPSMINHHKICVFDFETDSPDPHSCNPVELAAIMIDPRRLKFIKGSEFSSMMRPVDIDDEGYFETHKDTIDWHARTLGKKSSEVLQSWRDAPLQKNVWKDFKRYLDMYHIGDNRKSAYSAPLMAGYNNNNFDDHIIKRLSEKYKDVDKRNECKLFFRRDNIDALSLTFLFFENNEEPNSYSMDTMRGYLGMSTKDAHQALTDVRQTGELIIRYMRVIRRAVKDMNFKDSCKNNPLI